MALDPIGTVLEGPWNLLVFVAWLRLDLSCSLRFAASLLQTIEEREESKHLEPRSCPVIFFALAGLRYVPCLRHATLPLKLHCGAPSSLPSLPSSSHPIPTALGSSAGFYSVFFHPFHPLQSVRFIQKGGKEINISLLACASCGAKASITTPIQRKKKCKTSRNSAACPG